MSESRLLPPALVNELQALATESDNDIKDGVILPNWPLKSINDLKFLITRRSHVLNATHLASIFKYLASLDYFLQEEFKETINTVIQICILLLSDKQKLSIIKPAELVSIIKSLPHLRISYSSKV